MEPLGIARSHSKGCVAAGFQVQASRANRGNNTVGNLSEVIPEGPYTLTMELGTKKTIPILVLGT